MSISKRYEPNHTKYATHSKSKTLQITDNNKNIFKLIFDVRIKKQTNTLNAGVLCRHSHISTYALQPLYNIYSHKLTPAHKQTNWQKTSSMSMPSVPFTTACTNQTTRSKDFKILIALRRLEIVLSIGCLYRECTYTHTHIVLHLECGAYVRFRESKHCA